MGEKARLETLLREYETLREEILQCVRLQYRIITAGILFLGTALGIAFEYHSVFLVIPPVLAAVFSLWATEQSRMMRAGNYIQMLENRINMELKGIYVFWENWIRIGKPPLSLPHHISQYIGISASFLFICAFAIWAIWYFPLPELAEPARVCITAVYIGLLLLISYLAFRTIKHGWVSIREFEKTKEKYKKILIEHKLVSPREFEKTKKEV